MRVEDINILEIVGSDLQKTIEIEVKTPKGIVHSSAPINKNGIYRLRSHDAEEMIRNSLK